MANSLLQIGGSESWIANWPASWNPFENILLKQLVQFSLVLIHVTNVATTSLISTQRRPKACKNIVAVNIGNYLVNKMTSPDVTVAINRKRSIPSTAPLSCTWVVVAV